MDARIPVILDVDTGIDDAFALLLAALHPRLNLLGVTCVDGNAPVAAVVQNTLRVLDAAGRPDVPVVAGAHRPLVAQPHYAYEVHGTDGFGDIDWPTSARTPHDADAVTWLHQTITRSTEPVTLVTLAPLTNIALLFQQHPDVQGHLKRIVVMGGSAGPGNVTALAEFNVHHDPEAAALVFASEVPITMYGLDVFNDVVIDQADVVRLAAAPTHAAQLAARLAEFFATVLSYPLCIGDAGAVCAVIDPDALTTARLTTTVVTTPGVAYGMTATDRRPIVYDGAVPLEGRVIDVALDINAARYSELWLSTLMT